MNFMVLDVEGTHEGNPNCKKRLVQDPSGKWYCADCGLQIMYQSLSAEEIKKRDLENPHVGCLRTANIVLNLHQNIEDILISLSLSDSEKLQKIKAENGLIGKTVTKYLPG
jgi:hypothetical protein